MYTATVGIGSGLTSGRSRLRTKKKRQSSIGSKMRRRDSAMLVRMMTNAEVDGGEDERREIS